MEALARTYFQVHQALRNQPTVSCWGFSNVSGEDKMFYDEDKVFYFVERSEKQITGVTD